MAEQLELPGVESQLKLPLQTMQLEGKKYKLFGMFFECILGVMLKKHHWGGPIS